MRLYTLFFQWAFVAAAATTTAFAAQARTELKWIQGSGDQTTLDWSSEIRWAWKKVGQLPQPFMEVWISLPKHIDLESLKSKAARIEGEDDPKKYLVVDMQSSSTTVGVVKQSAGLSKDEGVAITVVPEKPTFLVHKSCQALGIRPVLSSFDYHFLYLGIYCEKSQKKRVKVHVWVSADSEAYAFRDGKQYLLSRTEPLIINGVNRSDLNKTVLIKSVVKKGVSKVVLKHCAKMALKAHG